MIKWGDIHVTECFKDLESTKLIQIETLKNMQSNHIYNLNVQKLKYVKMKYGISIWNKRRCLKILNND